MVVGRYEQADAPVVSTAAAGKEPTPSAAAIHAAKNPTSPVHSASRNAASKGAHGLTTPQAPISSARNTHEEYERQKALRTAQMVQDGGILHNSEIESRLAHAQLTMADQANKAALSPEGRVVAADIQDVISATRDVLAQRNQDETIQKLAYSSTHATVSGPRAVAQEGSSAVLPGSVIRSESDTVLQNMREVVQLMGTSTEFRSIIYDFNAIVRDFFINPSESALQPIGAAPVSSAGSSAGIQPAATRYSGGGMMTDTAGALPTELLASQPAGSFHTFDPSSMHLRSGTVQSNMLVSEGNVRDAGFVGSTLPQQSVGMQPQPMPQQSVGMQPVGMQPVGMQQQQQQWSGSSQQQWGQQQQQWGGSSMWDDRNTMESPRLPKGKKSWLAPNQAFLTRELTPQAREELALRWQTLVLRAHNDQTNLTALSQFIDFGKDMYRRERELVEHRRTAPRVAKPLNPQAFDAEAHSIAVRHYLQQLCESFAQGHSLDYLLLSIKQFVHSLSADTTIREFSTRLGRFLDRSLKDRAFVSSAGYKDETVRMIIDERRLMMKHRVELERILREADSYLTDLRGDPVTQHLTEATNKLVRDLFLNDNGKLSIKPQALNDLRLLLVPIIANQFRYIAIPRISGSDESMDYLVENIVFERSEIIPDWIKIANENDVEINTVSGVSTEDFVTRLRVTLSDMTATLTDVGFAYRRKKFPRMDDRGLVDIKLPPPGISIVAKLRVTTNFSQNSQHVFTLDSIKCKLAKVDLENIRAEEHKLLYTLLKPIIQSRARRAVKQAIEEKFAASLNMLDQQVLRALQHIHYGGTGGTSGSKGILRQLATSATTTTTK